MLFNAPSYGFFLIGCFTVAWALYAHRRARALFLLAASYAFYFYGTFEASQDGAVPGRPLTWSLFCLSIIFVGSSLDFLIGRALGRAKSELWRKALLAFSIAYYLGVLGFFKYWNFAADVTVETARWFGVGLEPWHLQLVLPFGISFFTFETMSYTIDVYRRELEPAESYVDYLLFVSFFPHLVAGPIVRARDMLAQFRASPRYDPDEQSAGLFRIAVGLAKKVAVGDVLAAHLVNRAFGNPERYSSLELLFAVYGYAVQIYMDFSGYSDIAIGSAQLLGYRLPVNFRAPYSARDLQDFWRRWHISLSTWLRDYLYIPLGGSRRGGLRTYRNLTITMLLGGLWHGASWNFVFWGALHGIGLAATRAWQKRFAAFATGRMGQWFGAFLTFHFVCFAWIFFRAPTFGHAFALLNRLGQLGLGAANLPARVVLLVVFSLALQFVPETWEDRVRQRFSRAPSYVQGTVLAATAVALHFAAESRPAPFVYGQF